MDDIRRAFADANRATERRIAEQFFAEYVEPRADWQEIVNHPGFPPDLLAAFREDVIGQIARLMAARWERA